MVKLVYESSGEVFVRSLFVEHAEIAKFNSEHGEIAWLIAEHGAIAWLI